MEKICKNCKFWKRIAKDYGECKADFFFGFNEGGEEAFAKEIKEISPENNFLVYLRENVYEHWYDGYDSKVVSGENFGCVHYQPNSQK